jgi:hypothetical protein
LDKNYARVKVIPSNIYSERSVSQAKAGYAGERVEVSLTESGGFGEILVDLRHAVEEFGVAGSDGWDVEILPHPLSDSTVVRPITAF